MDHELISKVIKNYIKLYVPKYLQQWIKIGTMGKDQISLLKECALKSTVSEYAKDHQFIAYVEVNMWIGTCEYPWSRKIVLPLLLSDSMEKIKLQLQKQQECMNLEFRSSMIGQDVRPTSTNW